MTRALVPLRRPRSARHRLDQEFLPPALAIIETPPSPIRITLIWMIGALFLLAFFWSYLGRIDIIASAPGKVHPVGSIKVVEPLQTGRVVAIMAHNGQIVSAGDKLVLLDQTDALSEQKATLEALNSAQGEVARRTAEQNAVLSKTLRVTPQVAWPKDIPEEIKFRESQLLHSEFTALSSSILTLQSQSEKNHENQRGLEATIGAEHQLIDTDQERVQMRLDLFQRKAGTKTDYINAMETLRYQQMMLAQFQTELSQAKAEAAVINDKISETYDKFAAENAQKMEKAQRIADDLKQQLSKDQSALNATVLRSPIDGVVQGLTVTSIGQILQSGSEAMQIAPINAPLEIEAYLPDADRGFVKEGDSAIIKVASFPFTRYGTLEATVVRIAHDALPSPDALQTEANPVVSRSDSTSASPRMLNLVYPITLRLRTDAFDVHGQKIQLAPGMSVTAEIRTGTRRIIDYVLSPLSEVGSQALHER